MTASDASENDKPASPVVAEKQPTPSVDVELKGTVDAAIPQKREREVSLEPATPHPDDSETGPVRMREKEARTPAKKNRTHLSTTEEEHEADVEADMPADEPDATADELDATADVDANIPDAEPPSLLKTPNTVTAPLLPPADKDVDIVQPLTPPPTSDTPPTPDTSAPSKPLVPPSSPSKRSREEDEDVSPRQAKRPTPPPADEPPKEGDKETTTSKHVREDSDKDDSPRPTKRPTPPPAEEQPVASGSSTVAAPKSAPAFGGGFAAYASASSPFAAVKGPQVFGSKPKSPSPWASGNGSASTSLAPFAAIAPSTSPFAKGLTSPPSSPKPAAAQTPAKRTGFEAFASASPFALAASRPRSPDRSKSPVRRGANHAAAAKAFSAYATGGAQGLFASPAGPAAKRARAESPSANGDASTKDEDEDGEKKERRASGSSEEADEKDKESAAGNGKTFREQLREDRKENGVGNGHAAGESYVWGEPAATSSIEEKDVTTGEEEEMPVSSVRGKLFVLNEQNQWKERGTGTIRLNVKREDQSTPRLVMRKDAVLSVLLNVPLFKGMHCSIAQDPRYIRVSAIEDGSLTHYNIRVGSPTAAETLHKAIAAWTPGNDAQLTRWKREKADLDRFAVGRRP